MNKLTELLKMISRKKEAFMLKEGFISFNITALLLILLIPLSAYAAPGDVWMQPSIKSIAINEEFTLDVHADTGAQKLGAYQFTIAFDPLIINVDTAKGNNGVDAGTNGFISAVNADNTNGKIIINGFDVAGKGPGIDLNILTIYFNNITAGQTSIDVAVNIFTDEMGSTIGDPKGESAVVKTPDIPDLLVTSVSDPPTEKKRGGKFTINDSVMNQREMTADKYTIRYYLSPDIVKDGGDILLKGKRTVKKLKAGKDSEGKTKVTIPESTLIGNYYLIACADDTSNITESDEDNNCMASSTTIEVK